LKKRRDVPQGCIEVLLCDPSPGQETIVAYPIRRKAGNEIIERIGRKAKKERADQFTRLWVFGSFAAYLQAI
jgi:hypothetical protein